MIMSRFNFLLDSL